MAKKGKEPMRFGTKMVIISLGGMVSYTLLLYSIVIMNMLLGTNVEMPTEWNNYIFAFLTVEIVSLACLRLPEKVKSKYEKDDSDEKKESKDESEQVRKP